MNRAVSTNTVLRKRFRVFPSMKGSKSHRLEPFGVFQDMFTSATKVYLLNHVREVGKDDSET